MNSINNDHQSEFREDNISIQKPPNIEYTTLKGSETDEVEMKKLKKKCVMITLSIVLFIIVMTVVLALTLKKKIEADSDSDNKDDDKPDNFLKSKYDKNQYENFQLKNGMNVLLVKVPINYDSGLVLYINGLGSFSDPIEYPGLSHFLEHMVFRGSKNYAESEFLEQMFINKAQVNGITAYNYTIFPNIVVKESILKEIISRISDFVLNPILNQSRAEKEIFAVDSEYYNNLIGQNIFLRSHQFFANPKHPYSKFLFGNYETLINSVKQNCSIMREYFEKVYAPKNMYLVVQTHKYNANHVKNQIEETFGDIPIERNSKYEPQKTSFDTPVYNQSLLGSIIKLYQTSLITNVEIMIPLMQIEPIYLQFLQTLLQLVEDPCIYFQLQLYVYECRINYAFITDSQNLLLLQMQLTDSGKQNFLQMQNLICETLKMVKQKVAEYKKNYNSKLHAEMQNNQNYFFQNRPNQGTYSELYQIAMQFAANQTNKFLYHSYDLSSFDIEDFSEKMSSQLNLENSITFLKGDDFSKFYENALEKNDTSSEEIKKIKNLQDWIQENAYLSNSLYDIKYLIHHNYFSVSNNNPQKQKGEQQVQNNNNSSIQQLQFDDQKKIEDSFIMKVAKINRKNFNFNQNPFNNDLPHISQQAILINQNENTELVSNDEVKNFLGKKQEKVLSEQLQKHNLELLISNKKGNLYYLTKKTEDIKYFQVHILFEMNYNENSQNQIIKKKVQQYFQKSYLKFIFPSLDLQVSTLGLECSFQCNDLTKCQEFINTTLVSINQIKDESDEQIEFFKHYTINNINQWYEKQIYAEFTLTDFIDKNSISLQELIPEIRNFQKYQIQIYDRIDMLISGQIDKKESETLFQFVTDTLQITGNFVSPQLCQLLDLRESKTLITYRAFHQYQDKHNAVIANLYQMGPLKSQDIKILNVLQNYIDAYSFSFLRGEQMLGYVIQTKIVKTYNFFNLQIYVQGYKKSASEMEFILEQNLAFIQRKLETDVNNETDFNKPFLFMPNFATTAQLEKEAWTFITQRDFESDTNLNLQISYKDLMKKFFEWFQQKKSRLSIQLENKHKTMNLPKDKLTSSQSFSQAETQLFFLKQELFENLTTIDMNNNPQTQL